jgi:hypothetical protein
MLSRVAGVAVWRGTFGAVNRGQDTHDLDIRGIGGTHIFQFPSVQPGGVVDRELKLAPGRYLPWCAIADHRELGMHATLRVVRPKPAG